MDGWRKWKEDEEREYKMSKSDKERKKRGIEIFYFLFHKIPVISILK